MGSTWCKNIYRKLLLILNENLGMLNPNKVLQKKAQSIHCTVPY